jgi:hypothetical protein
MTKARPFPFCPELRIYFIKVQKAVKERKKGSFLRDGLEKSKKNDIEGNYRFHWMLKDSLKSF